MPKMFNMLQYMLIMPFFYYQQHAVIEKQYLRSLSAVCAGYPSNNEKYFLSEMVYSQVLYVLYGIEYPVLRLQNIIDIKGSETLMPGTFLSQAHNGFRDLQNMSFFFLQNCFLFF